MTPFTGHALQMSRKRDRLFEIRSALKSDLKVGKFIAIVF